MGKESVPESSVDIARRCDAAPNLHEGVDATLTRVEQAAERR
jgi:hypothetical protein